LYSYDLPGTGNFSPSRVPCLYNYLRWAFLAQKGGIRKRIRIVKNNTNPLPDFRVNVSLRPDESTTAGAGWINGGVGTVRGPVMDGTVTFMTSVNSGLEFEIPFYSNNLFSWACNADQWFNTGLSVIQVDNLRSYNIDIDGFDATTSNIYVAETFAAGEDFTFMRWLGSPPVRLNATVS
jgi:hypothetical protein